MYTEPLYDHHLGRDNPLPRQHHCTLYCAWYCYFTQKVLWIQLLVIYFHKKDTYSKTSLWWCLNFSQVDDFPWEGHIWLSVAYTYLYVFSTACFLKYVVHIHAIHLHSKAVPWVQPSYWGGWYQTWLEGCGGHAACQCHWGKYSRTFLAEVCHPHPHVRWYWK